MAIDRMVKEVLTAASRGRDRGRRPGPAARDPPAGVPNCQNTSMGMPPRGNQ